MSKESVVEFMRRVDEDAALREELDRALDDGDSPVASFLAVAGGRGFEFTADEYLEAVGSGGGELTDRELENVAGGLGRLAAVHGKASIVLGRYRGALGAAQIRPRGVAMSEEEEELQT